MPYIDIHGAHIYYETFGKEKTGQAPILLIHGSTGTGQSNWREVAPLLAREYFVIVPDCRGHGKSSNPNLSYSFKEMAADTAALVHTLGYERAHIIGHSNGGNVALVTLLEHPEIVQTAIPQAANAWVSPDLIEKEPPIFDPDRVKRESPDWMNEMIALHGETHGSVYWRDLLRLTVDELIHEPNYTPEDLQAVRRPTLVIQGEVDRVNAPYKHAQFIARYIPDAELWIPKNIGHTVHDEMLFEWVERVFDFLKRRGDDDNDALYRLGQRYSDTRDWIYELQAERVAADQAGAIKIAGKVLREEQRLAALELFADRLVNDEIQVLLDDSTPWGLVNRNVTDLRNEPRRLSERHNQALLGEAVRILEDAGEWVKVRLEEDGYLGWIKTAAVYRCEEAAVQEYQSSCTHLVAEGIAPGFTSSELDRVAIQLPFGVAVPVVERRNGRSAICMPDGKCWWVADDALLLLADRPKLDVEGIQRTLAVISRFIGIPYLWGGRTPCGFDCSGLALTFYRFMGLRLKRDAGQQMESGVRVEGEILPGDLLFFGEAQESLLLPGEAVDITQNITHVAIALGDAEIIHATGSVDGITINSLDPESPVFSPWLKAHLAGVRRFA